MKTRKKLLIALLSATCLTAGAVGIAACSKTPETNDKTLVGIYNAYVAEAGANNETVLTYEEWLKEKFENAGQKGEAGEDGKSAYEIYRDAVYNNGGSPLDETAWLASLIGASGVTPSIGTNGNWFLGTTDTGVKAAGTSGEDGVGITKVEMSADGKSLVVTFTKGNPVTVVLPESITHVHAYNNEYTVLIPPSGETEGLGYKVCTVEGCEHIELVTIGTYSYKITVYLSDVEGEASFTGTVVAGAKVTLKDSKGETVAQTTTDERGEAVFEELEKGVYTIEVTKDGYVSYANFDADFAQVYGSTSKNASDYPALLLTLPSDGTGTDEDRYEFTNSLDQEIFYLEAPVFAYRGELYPDNTYVTFTASKAGRYTFFNSGFNSEEVDMLDLSTYQQETAFVKLLDEGEAFTFQIRTGDIEDEDFKGLMLFVACEEVERGSEEMPVTVKLTDEVSFSTENDKDTYFKLAKGSDGATQTKIVFDEDNLTVEEVGGSAVSSGDVLTAGSVLKVSAKDGNIEFETQTYYALGEKANPFELELNEEQNVEIADGKYSANVWYEFEVDEDATYTFVTSNSLTFYVYSDLSSTADKTYYNTTLFSHYFAAGTYYVNVTTYSDGSFTVREYDESTDKGLTAADPITVGADGVSLTADNKYYKYTATADGFVVFETNGYFEAYTDAGYSVYSHSSTRNAPLAVTSGDSVYLVARSNGATDAKLTPDFTASDAKVNYTVTVTNSATGAKVEGVKVVLTDGNSTVAQATTDADGVATFNGVTAGSYSVVIELTDEQENSFEWSEADAQTVNVLNTSASVALTAYVTYEVEVVGADDLDGVTVTIATMILSKTGVTWEAVKTVDVENGKAVFSKLPSGSYRFSVKGLPDGYSVETNSKDGYVYTANGAPYTFTVSAPVDTGDVVNLGVFTEDDLAAGIDRDITVTETTTYEFTLPMPDTMDYDCWIEVKNGYIQSMTDTNVQYSFQDRQETMYNISGWSQRTITFVIVPTDDGETTFNFFIELI